MDLYDINLSIVLQCRSCCWPCLYYTNTSVLWLSPCWESNCV